MSLRVLVACKRVIDYAVKVCNWSECSSLYYLDSLHSCFQLASAGT